MKFMPENLLQENSKTILLDTSLALPSHLANSQPQKLGSNKYSKQLQSMRIDNMSKRKQEDDKFKENNELTEIKGQSIKAEATSKFTVDSQL